MKNHCQRLTRNEKLKAIFILAFKVPLKIDCVRSVSFGAMGWGWCNEINLIVY